MDTSENRAHVSIRALRGDLAAAVRRAGAGQTTVVTVGGDAVAELGPIGSTAAAADLATLIAIGAVRPPARTSAFRPPEPVRTWSTVRLDRIRSPF